MKRLELLDYGRFIAAIYVVFHHYFYNGIANGKVSSIQHIPEIMNFAKYGYLGVEFFFMISGFVIFFSASNNTATKFVTSRALRLYPSYWCAILFTAGFAFFWANEAMLVTPKMILVNFTLLQNYLWVASVDGVYWTLFYEVKFYFAVFILLLLGARQQLTTLFCLWPFLMLLALSLGFSDIEFLGGYYSFFAAGACLAIVRDKQLKRYWLPVVVCFGLCLEFTLSNAMTSDKDLSLLLVALLISLFFAFFILQISSLMANRTLPYSRTLGALTYPVYLIHAHFGYMVLNQFANEENKYIVYLVVISIVLVTAYFINQMVEIKMKDIWKMLFTNTITPFVNLLEKGFQKYPLFR